VRRTLLALAVAILMAGMSARAHHSFARYYLEDQSITIEGEVREFQYRSPHAILLFAVHTPDGSTRTYEAEWSNPRRLGGQGVDKGTLKPGDVVVVTGSPGRAGSENKVHLKGIRRPVDGWSWTGGRRRR
jgi:hypothetical protein